MADEPDADGPVVVTFFGDGGYLLTHVKNGENHDERGIEQGTWSVGAGNVLTTTQTVDTNGDAGLSDELERTLKVNAAGRLEMGVETEGTFFFDRLPLAAPSP